MYCTYYLPQVDLLDVGPIPALGDNSRTQTEHTDTNTPSARRTTLGLRTRTGRGQVSDCGLNLPHGCMARTTPTEGARGGGKRRPITSEVAVWRGDLLPLPSPVVIFNPSPGNEFVPCLYYTLMIAYILLSLNLFDKI